MNGFLSKEVLICVRQPQPLKRTLNFEKGVSNELYWKRGRLCIMVYVDSRDYVESNKQLKRNTRGQA